MAATTRSAKAWVEVMAKRAWELFGHLVSYGIIRLPDFDKLTDEATAEEARWLEGVIAELVLTFQAMRLTDDQF